ncbi:MAG: C1q-like domain-containing protein [Bacillota bacterium]
MDNFTSLLESLIEVKIKNLQKQLQLQSQHQQQGQSDVDIDNISNVGNPVININLDKFSEKKKKVEKKQSAFRAVKNTATLIPVADTNVKVSFANEQFDLNNEYNSSTSTFVAKTPGIYLFTSTLIFDPNDDVDYEFGINLVVNGGARDVDADYTGFNASYFNTVDLSEIVKLEEGDTVEIFAFSSTPGTIIAEHRTSFAGSRLNS